MTREWQIWVCPQCPMIMEYNEEEKQMYCTGDGCGSTWMDWEPTSYGAFGHKQTEMELVSVREINEPTS